MIGKSWNEYIRSLQTPEYRALQEAHDNIRNNEWEDRMAERVAKKVMYMIDTSQAIGKLKELNDMLNNLGDK